MPNQYHQATESDFPRGSLVFYCDIKSYNSKTTGIKHVGIVVGNKHGSPLIAHAATSDNVEHVLVSRLPESDSRVGYITVKLPDTFNIDLIVALATALSTTNSEETPKVLYSDHRCQQMERRLAQQFQDNSSISDNKKTVYINSIRDNILASMSDFTDSQRLAGWYTMLAKALNIARSDFIGDIKDNIDSNKLNKTLLAALSKNFPEKFSKYNFSSKGYHCVQFVVAILQISFLLSDNYIRSFLTDTTKKQNIYFSRKNSGMGNLGVNAVHPRYAINDGMVISFREYFLENSLPVDGKMLSPAGLLYMFYRGDQGPQGPNAGIGGVSISSTFGVLSLISLTTAIVNLKRHLNRQAIDSNQRLRLPVVRRINALLELISVRQVLKKILNTEVYTISYNIEHEPSRSIRRLNRRQRLPDSDLSHAPAPKMSRR